MDNKGKAARNEKRKLYAAYINSFAIGLGLIGVVTPYLSFSYTTLGLGRSLADYSLRQITSVVFMALGCAWISLKLHDYASKILSDIED